MVKRSWKFKLIIILILLVIASGTCLYFWYGSTSKLRQEAREVIKEAKSYTALKEYLGEEYDRCQEFIAQKEGDFGSFEYCKNFIEWVNKAPLLD